MSQLLEQEDNDDEFYVSHYGENVFNESSSEYHSSEDGDLHVCPHMPAAPFGSFRVHLSVRPSVCPSVCLLLLSVRPLPFCLPCLMVCPDSADEFDTDYATDVEEEEGAAPAPEAAEPDTSLVSR